MWVFLKKILVLYSDRPKSWIWLTLGHVRDIFCKFHLHNTSKEVFQQKKNWIPCTGLKVPFWQFFNSGKMALLNCCRNSSGFTTMAMINPPESKLKKRTSVRCMEFKKKIRPKDFFWSVMKMTFTRNIPNMPQGQPNPWFRSIRVQNWDFLKKDSKDLKNSFHFGFLCVPSKTGEQN